MKNVCPLVFHHSTNSLAFSMPFIFIFITALIADPASAEVASSEKNFSTLEEVVVTARRREESMQESPVAVTAISGDTLRNSGIVNTDELSKSVPSLQINAGQDNMIFIRGVGQRAAGSFLQVDPAVSVYVDDLLLPRPDAQLLDTVDVQSIQVLRGPQGTLFGKNNTGGALVFSLIKPHDERQGYIEAGVGNYNLRRTRVGLNFPVSDELFTRFSFNVTKNDGYMKDLTQSNTSSDDRLSLLFQTRWDASETSTLDTLTYYGKVRERHPVTHCRITNKNSLLNQGIGLLYSGDTDPSNPTAFTDNCEANSPDRLPDLTSNIGSFKPNFTVETLLFGVTFENVISGVSSIKLITGLRDERKGPKHQNNTDGGPAAFREGIQSDDSMRQSASVELQFNSSAFDQRLTYTAGLFGMVEHNTDKVLRVTELNGIDASALALLLAGQSPDSSLVPPFGTSPPLVGPLAGEPNAIDDSDLRNSTMAAFFQGSFTLTENVEITAGARYTIETRAAEIEQTLTDREALADIIASHPRFGPAAAAGLHPFLGSWIEDPISIANSLFERNEFGVIAVPLDYANATTEKIEGTFSKFTPMVSASYLASDSLLDTLSADSLMFYATWSSGFKSGFFEPKGVDGLQTVEPEELENREVGFKLDTFDSRLRINAAFYSMLFENMQLIQVSADSAGNLAVVFKNAGRSKIEGAEVEVNWIPIPRLALNASFSKNSYKFIEFEEFALGPLLQSGEQHIVDRTDEDFPVSPELSASLGIQYTWRSSVGSITPRVDISYKGDIYQGFDRGSWIVNKQNEDMATSAAYTLIDARLGWRCNDDTLTITVFGKNLADERYDLTGVSIGDLVGIYQQSVGEPRTYGVELRHTF
ncbi:MAG: iron complex outermembrane receptor protein [Paracoccaceae bacterium]|jgi:iron complex outermembrane receptor protein